MCSFSLIILFANINIASLFTLNEGLEVQITLIINICVMK